MIDPTQAEHARAIKALTDKYFLSFNQPKDFSAHAKGFIISQENAFEELCALLEDNGAKDARNLSVHAFMTRIALIEKKLKPKK